MPPPALGDKRAARRRRSRILATVAAVILGIALVPRVAAAGRAGRVQASPLATTSFDARAFGRSLLAIEARPVAPMTGVRVVIVPHHWPAGALISGTLRDAVASPVGSHPWRRVVLLGPDHRKAGGRVVVSSPRAWSTPFGLVHGEADTVARLIRSGLAVDDGDLLAAEHGVAGLVPAIAYFMPEARIVPAAVRGDARPAETRRLALALASSVTADTLVVVSADFAHDVSSVEARRNDLRSVAALRDLDAERIRTFGDEHVDARGALGAAVQLARHLGATRFVVRERSDGSGLAGYAGGPVTSYITGYYAVPR